MISSGSRRLQIRCHVAHGQTLILFGACLACCLSGGCGSSTPRRPAGVEVRVVGLGHPLWHTLRCRCCCRPQCAAGQVRRLFAAYTQHQLSDRQDAVRPVAHTIPGLGGLHECPCVAHGDRHRFERAVVRDVARRWKSGQMADIAEGVTYLSLGAGGLFSDLLVLAGLFAQGVPISSVVLVDTIFEELLQVAAQQRSATHPCRTNQKSSRLAFEEDPATGLMQLTAAWRGSPCRPNPLPRLEGSRAAREESVAAEHEGHGEGQCRQCREAVSLAPLPPSNDLGLGVIDLLANFCGWLSLLTGTDTAPAPHREVGAGEESREEVRAGGHIGGDRGDGGYGGASGNVCVARARKAQVGSTTPRVRVIVLGHLSDLDTEPCGSAASKNTTTAVSVLPRAHVAIFSDLHWDHEVMPHKPQHVLFLLRITRLYLHHWRLRHLNHQIRV